MLCNSAEWIVNEIWFPKVLDYTQHFISWLLKLLEVYHVHSLPRSSSLLLHKNEVQGRGFLVSFFHLKNQWNWRQGSQKFIRLSLFPRKNLPNYWNFSFITQPVRSEVPKTHQSQKLPRLFKIDNQVLSQTYWLWISRKLNWDSCIFKKLSQVSLVCRPVWEPLS